MIKIKSEATPIETEIKEKVRCPLCRRMLFDVRFAKGILMLKVKCTKCKSYIDVDITGN